MKKKEVKRSEKKITTNAYNLRIKTKYLNET